MGPILEGGRGWICVQTFGGFLFGAGEELGVDCVVVVVVVVPLKRQIPKWCFPTCRLNFRTNSSKIFGHRNGVMDFQPSYAVFQLYGVTIKGCHQVIEGRIKSMFLWFFDRDLQQFFGCFVLKSISLAFSSCPFPSWGKMALRQWYGCQVSIASDQQRPQELLGRSCDAWLFKGSVLSDMPKKKSFWIPAEWVG